MSAGRRSGERAASGTTQSALAIQPAPAHTRQPAWEGEFPYGPLSAENESTCIARLATARADSAEPSAATSFAVIGICIAEPGIDPRQQTIPCPGRRTGDSTRHNQATSISSQSTRDESCRGERIDMGKAYRSVVHLRNAAASSARQGSGQHVPTDSIHLHVSDRECFADRYSHRTTTLRRHGAPAPDCAAATTAPTASTNSAVKGRPGTVKCMMAHQI
ncbi:hypothetical protein Fraau_1694 [Frateuria aurantia DSM 6220]|uniref:Uncharacterized protein n=1 Tax=Frateuria aurantia (strain ATCC 33424 / DSM 6220 / KCTC 2777 / LMG 1558 / NBRC 3245 / NCIMB 13370) TaxID=767434 RepID=H8KYA9_FRAAD|nr:hypothetical protein Fraau_1694 [Frateuria aurantia DSM 6220]